jgi:hypothetical protein
VQRTILILAILALVGWWLLVGENPLQLGRSFVGRGSRLTSSTLDANGNVVESIEDICAQVASALQRPVSEDAVLLARVSASENAGASEREKSAIQWVCRNDASAHLWSIRYTVTVNPGSLGVQTGRRYSTRGGGLLGNREIHEDDVNIAERVLSGEIGDLTGGATKFVHTTGFDSLAAFLGAHPKVQGWIDSGLEPIYLGDVGSLVVFREAT